MRGMNGSIALVSEPGEGAAFTVSVPRATPTAQPFKLPEKFPDQPWKKNKPV